MQRLIRRQVERAKWQAVCAGLPSVMLDASWRERTAGKRSFLMLTHDRDVDRRILQEAGTLRGAGWEGIIVAFSHDGREYLDSADGLAIHRISIGRIAPDCPAYSGWRCRSRLAARLPVPEFWHTLNWFVYRLSAGIRYGGCSFGHPLPFHSVFYETGGCYPADLVVAHDLPALGAALALSRKWRAPLVYDAHEFYPEQHVFPTAQKKILREAESRDIGQCQAVFTVNESIAAAISREYGIVPPRVLLNCVDGPADLDPDADLFRKRFGIPPERPVLLYQGGLSRNRNLDMLVDAMAHLPQPSPALIVMGGGELASRLRHRASAGGLREKVFFMEPVPQSRLLHWTCTADIGIIPYPAVDLNTTFATPNKLFEYIQAGLPILANDLPELRRFVRDAGFGRTAAFTSPQTMAASIAAMLGDGEKLVEMRQRLRKDAHLYSWAEQAKTYLSVIDGLVPRPHISGAS